MSSIAVKWSHSKDVLSRKLSPAALAVLRTLCYVYFDGTEDRRPKSKAKDDCYPTLNYLKDHTGFSVSAIKRARNELANEHLISWVTFGKGKGQSCAYQLNCPALHKVIWNNRRVSITFTPMPLKNAKSKKSSKDEALMGSQQALENGSQRATTSNDTLSVVKDSLTQNTESITSSLVCSSSLSNTDMKVDDDAHTHHEAKDAVTLKDGEFGPWIPAGELEAFLLREKLLVLREDDGSEFVDEYDLELLQRFLHFVGDSEENRFACVKLIEAQFEDGAAFDIEEILDRLEKLTEGNYHFTNRLAYVQSSVRLACSNSKISLGIALDEYSKKHRRRK